MGSINESLEHRSRRLFCSPMQAQSAYQRAHWSYSSLQQYLRCPLQFYFQRILRLPRESNTSSQALGSAVHATLAKYHESIRCNAPKSPSEVKKDFLNQWDNENGRSRIKFRAGETLGSVKDLGIGLISCYLETPPPEGILAIERLMIASVQNSRGEFLPTPLFAIADLVVQTSEGIRIVEFKTVAKSYSEFEVRLSLQSTFYLSAVHNAGLPTAGLTYGLLIKTKKPKYELRPTQRTEEDYGRLGDVIQEVEKGIQAGAFFPNESPMNCSGCPFYGPCRDWRSTTKVVSPVDHSMED